MSTSTRSSSRSAVSDIPSSGTSSCWSWAGAGSSAAWCSPPPTGRGASGSTPACPSRRRYGCVPRRRSSRASFRTTGRPRARCARCSSGSRRPWSWPRSTRPIWISPAPNGFTRSRSSPSPKQLRDEVRRETGLDCSVGIGPNRMIAKLASDAAKPKGLMEVRAGWEEGFLAGLPLRAMPGVGTQDGRAVGRAGTAGRLAGPSAWRKPPWSA